MKKPRQKTYGLNKNKYLLQPEYEELEALLMKFIAKNTRDCLLILLALRTGGRAQEILNIKKEDVNAYDETIMIHGIKGSNDREIPIPKPLFAILKKYMADRPGTRLFPISYSRLHQIWEHYRTAPKKFHSLRHTFAIRLYIKTKDLRLVQVALGHRNITNTMIYADYVYSQQEFKKLILDVA